MATAHLIENSSFLNIEQTVFTNKINTVLKELRRPPQLVAENKVLQKAAIFFFTVIYVVGFFGFILPIHADFVLLTPFNLMLSLAGVLYFHAPKNGHFILFCWVCAIVGFSVEAIGVNTGWIFGDYRYGRVLGVKVWNTPLSIAVNWLLTAYCSAVFTHFLCGEKIHWLLKASVAAALMVGLDVLIEPIAMKTDMWQWRDETVPLQNYIGWYAVSLPLQILFFKFIGGVKNIVAVAMFILQVLFFGLLNWFL